MWVCQVSVADHGLIGSGGLNQAQQDGSMQIHQPVFVERVSDW